MKILIVDNNVERPYWGSPSICRFAAAVAGATVHVRRAPQDDLPADLMQFDRVVLSGSGTSCLAQADWIDNLDSAIRKWVDAGTPLLGVCYGHQSVVRALAGRQHLQPAENAEFGWSRIERTEESPLLAGLPKSFWSFSAHFEEVYTLPQGFKAFAKSDWCGIQGFQLEGKPVFGVQFHPERNIEEGEDSFRERREKGVPKVLLHPEKSEKLFDAKVGELIFANFFAFPR